MKRNSLIQAALHLFHKNGFHAVGVDWIIAEAGVSKMTAYRCFLTKRHLIADTLEYADQTFKSHWHGNFLTFRSMNPTSRSHALFRWYESGIVADNPIFFVFDNAAMEYPDANTTIRNIVLRHKSFFYNAVSELYSDFQKPWIVDVMINQLEGAAMRKKLFPHQDQFGAARTAVGKLLETFSP